MREQSNNAGHPWLIGVAAGVVFVFTAIASATWLPRLSEPWAMMTIVGAVFALGILISTYWRFLRSWRLWITLTTVVALNAICIRIFLTRIRQLSLRDIDVILALELGATGLFLNWFLDTKKARAELSRRKQL